ncbi:hypothetical protein XI01_36565 [Bradyrhizobium sp. CCBAU 21360]|nr:hypothetical protein [Bradyrhizobium sp. CCBAU 21360]
MDFRNSRHLKWTTLPLSALDQEHAPAADVGIVTALGNIEPIEDAAKRIAQLRSIGELKCHELISKDVNWIALEELLAFARDAERNRALVFCRWLANHQPLALEHGGDLRCDAAGRAQKAGESRGRPRKPVCAGEKAQGHPFPIAQPRKAPFKKPAVGRLDQEL